MRHLTEKDRYYIEKSLKAKKPVKQIAEELGFSTVTIYAEIKKGKAMHLDYRTYIKSEVYLSDVGQRKHNKAMSKTGRHKKYDSDNQILKDISVWIKDNKYSPEAALYKTGHTEICVKTVYNYIHAGHLDGVEVNHLPYARLQKKKLKKVGKRVYSENKKSIEDRPKEILNRDTYGHWEMDTVYSSRDDKSALLVLTERMTRQELIFQIKDRTCQSVIKALDSYERKIGTPAFRNIFHTITCDNGVEFSDGALIERSCRTKKNRTTVYFCHPYCSGERGTNENLNRMIRRWIPKGDDIGLYSPKEILMIQEWINNYPRKIFKGKSSNQINSSLSTYTPALRIS